VTNPIASSDSAVGEPQAAASWKSWTGTIAGVVLGLVLVVALFPKTADPYAFAHVIEQQGLDFLLPARWVMFIGLAAEAVLGFALLLCIRRGWVLWSSVALVAFFLFLTGKHYYMVSHGLAGADENCGCFGDLIERSPAEAFWQDMFLLVPALLLSFLGRPARTDPLPRKRLAVIGGLTLGTLIWAACVPEPPPALREGVNVADLCIGEGEGEAGRLCLDAVVPALAEGDHVVILVALDDEDFLGRLGLLAEYTEAMDGPTLWVLSPVGDDSLEDLTFEQQPAFSLLGVPPVVLEPLYETLPRSFRVRDGVVTALWEGWPPFDQLAAGGGGADDEAGNPGDNKGRGNDPEDDDPDDKAHGEDGSGDDD